MSQSLNSCRTSKRGIADKTQCPSNSFRLQILIAFTIESGKSSAYFILIMLIFYWNKSFFINTPYWASISKFVRWERETRYYVPSTLCILSLSPSSRNTLHTDQVSFASPFKDSPNNVSCTGFTLSECNPIKTRKLLGDYSSENSECNRRELRTLEIHFLESV